MTDATPHQDPAGKKSEAESSERKSPRESPHFALLQQLFVQRGHAAKTFDTLCFAFGATETLHGHARVLDMLARIFDSRYFQDAGSWSQGPWSSHLNKWRQLLRSWPEVRRAIRVKLGTENDWLDPPIEVRNEVVSHPMRRHGMTEGPVATMLAVTHVLLDSKSADQRKRAEPYFLLQCVMLRASVEMRWASGTTDDYLASHDLSAYPHAPSAEHACRSVRLLSLGKSMPAASLLPLATDPSQYVQQMSEWADSLVKLDGAPTSRSVSADEDDEAPGGQGAREVSLYERGLAIVRYLAHWPAAYGEGSSRRVRPGTGSAGADHGTAPVDGHTADIPPEVQAPQIELVQTPPSGPSGSSGGTDPNAAPQEQEPPKLPLYPADDVAGKISELKWGGMRETMRAVHLLCDLHHLSPRMAHGLYAHGQQAVLDDIGSGFPLQRRTAFGSLLVLMSLCFGQFASTIHRTRIACIRSVRKSPEAGATRDFTLEDALRHPIDAPVLLLESDESSAGPVTVLGFVVPAVSPAYVPNANSLQNEHRVLNMLLPAVGLGDLLLRWHRHMQDLAPAQPEPKSSPPKLDWPGVAAFSTELSDAKLHPAAVAETCMREYLAHLAVTPGTSSVTWSGEGTPPSAPPGWNGWSLARLASLLGRTIGARTGDRVLVWQITSDQGAAHEAPLYYTQTPLDQSARVWVDAVRSAGLADAFRQANAGQPTPDMVATVGPNGDASTHWLDRWLSRTQLERFVIGCRFVASLEEERAFLKVLKEQLSTSPDRGIRQEVREYHNARVLRVIKLNSLSTALRPIVSPVTLLRAVEQHDRIREWARLPPSSESVHAGVGDKDTYYSQRARKVCVPPVAVDEIRRLRGAQQDLQRLLHLQGKWPAEKEHLRALCQLDDKGLPSEVTVTWIERQFEKHGYPWPANYARALLRTELMKRGCAPADLDALMGHRSPGGGAINLHSTLDFSLSDARVQKALNSLFKELGLSSAHRSSAEPAITRPLEPDPLLAPMDKAGPMGSSRSETEPRSAGVPAGLTSLWELVHQKASRGDQRQTAWLVRQLSELAHHGNAYAALMVSPDPVQCALALLRASDDASDQRGDLDDDVQRRDRLLASAATAAYDAFAQLAASQAQTRFQLAASWFRLLDRANALVGKDNVVLPAPPPVDDLHLKKSLWDLVHERVNLDDRREIAWLLRLLRYMAHRGNAYARLLVSTDPAEHAAALLQTPDDASGLRGPLSEVVESRDQLLAGAAQAVFDALERLAVTGTRTRFQQAASWFRLLYRANKQLGKQKVALPVPPQVAVVRPPTSPFTENAMLALPLVEGWRNALLQWVFAALRNARTKTGTTANVNPAPDVYSAQSWACALLMSAALFGSLLDTTALGMLLKRFIQGPRDLPLATAAGHAFLDIEVPGSGAVARQWRRWWFDPITQVIWLHAPASLPDMSIGDLHPWFRSITICGFKGSATWKFEPRGLTDLVKCAELWWLARTSRSFASVQSRRVDSSSLETQCLGRLVSVQQIKGPAVDTGTAPAQRPIEAHEDFARSDLEKLAQIRFAGKTRASDDSSEQEDTELSADSELARFAHQTHVWLPSILDILREATKPEQPAVTSSMLRGELPVDAGPTARVLVDFAAWLIDPSGGRRTLKESSRLLSTAALTLLFSFGDKPDAQVADAPAIARLMLGDEEIAQSSQHTAQGRAEALQLYADFQGYGDEVRELVMELLDEVTPEEVDGSVGPWKLMRMAHVDARVLSFDEYARIQVALQSADQSSINAHDREVASLLLMLCFLLGLRPGEVYGLRLDDLNEDRINVLRYDGHQLKSDNAIRSVQLDVFLNRVEIDRLHAFAAERRAASNGSSTLFGTTKADRARIDRFTRQVMRSVTGDPEIILYHARHSFASWLQLAFFAVDYPQTSEFFDKLPLTQAFLQRGPELEVQLFGSRAAALGKGHFAIARVVGHVGPSISQLHYMHFGDIMQAVIVQREAMALPKEIWMNILDKEDSTYYRLIQGLSDTRDLIANLRKRAKWKVGKLYVERPKDPRSRARRSFGIGSERPASSSWFGIDTFVDLPYRLADEAQTIAWIVENHGLAMPRVETSLRILRESLVRAAPPGKAAGRAAADGHLTFKLSDEKHAMAQQAEAWMRARCDQDPAGLRDDLEFLLDRFERRDADFHAAKAPDLVRLAGIFSSMGICMEAMRLVVRNATKTCVLPSWVEATDIGTYAGSEITAIKAQSAAPSYARWIGLEPISTAKEGCGRVFAKAFALGLAIVGSSLGLSQ